MRIYCIILYSLTLYFLAISISFFIIYSDDFVSAKIVYNQSSLISIIIHTLRLLVCDISQNILIIPSIERKLILLIGLIAAGACIWYSHNIVSINTNYKLDIRLKLLLCVVLLSPNTPNSDPEGFPRYYYALCHIVIGINSSACASKPSH